MMVRRILKWLAIGIGVIATLLCVCLFWFGRFMSEGVLRNETLVAMRL